MSNLFWLSRPQIEKIKPYFPKSRGKPRVDDRRVLSGIMFVLRNGLRWKDAPAAYGPYKTLYNRWIRWSRQGIFAQILAALSASSDATDTLMVDATHIKAHRTASSLRLKKNRGVGSLGAQPGA